MNTCKHAYHRWDSAPQIVFTFSALGTQGTAAMCPKCRKRTFDLIDVDGASLLTSENTYEEYFGWNWLGLLTEVWEAVVWWVGDLIPTVRRRREARWKQAAADEAALLAKLFPEDGDV